MKPLELVLRFPRTCLVVMILATLFVGYHARYTRYDASIRTLIMEDDADYAFYNSYKKAFGQDDLIVIAFETDDVFTSGTLAVIRQLTGQLEEVDNVFDVKSLTNAEYMRGTEDSFETVPLLGDDIPQDPETLAAKKAVAIHSPLFCKDVISPDARSSAIIVTFRAVKTEYNYQTELEQIERIVRDASERSGIEMYLVGERLFDLRFVQYIHSDLRKFVPLTYVMLTVLLFLVFRSVRYTVIGIAAISACLVWVAGLVPLTGWEMNSMNSGLPSLILCIAVTDAVHIIHRYRQVHARIPGARDALAAALKEVTLPCFLTSLTTAIGFGSLMANKIYPIKGFGFLAALGVCACFVVCITIVPALILLWKEKPGAAVHEAEFVRRPYMTALADILTRRRRAVVVCVLLVLAVAFAGIARIETQSDRKLYLRKSSRLYKALDFIETRLVGTQQLDVWIETGREGRVKDPDVIRKIEDLNAFLRAQPEITDRGKVLSINEFLKEMNQAFHQDDPACYELPDTREQIAQFLLIYSMSGRENELDKYVDYPYSRTRISVRCDEHNSARLHELIGRINTYLGANFRGDVTARLASMTVVYDNVFRYLLKGLLGSLGIAVVLIGIVMCVCFRSVLIGLVSMIPNLIPIAVCLGLMGWLGIWLEIATAMTFSIALGIAVDDTIHFLARFRLEMQRTDDQSEAMRAALETVGSALVETTTIIVGGFLVLAFANLKMTVCFGLLCAFIMVVTLLADLVITPLCAVMFRLYRRPGSSPTQART